MSKSLLIECLEDLSLLEDLSPEVNLIMFSYIENFRLPSLPVTVEALD